MEFLYLKNEKILEKIKEKIKYDKIDPSNSEHNSELATNVMKDLGIPVLVYPDEIHEEGETDEKTLLTQLATAKVILDEKEAARSNVEQINAPVVQQNDDDIYDISDSSDDVIIKKILNKETIINNTQENDIENIDDDNNFESFY